jgi:hypothetical protein
MIKAKLIPGIISAALAAAAVTSLVSINTAAAEGCDDEAKTDDKKSNARVEIINGKRVIVIDKEITVCGKVPRPSVVYVLTTKNINYEWESLKQDFMPLILQSVRKAPF